MGEKYYFCNSYLKAQIQDGCLVSMAAAGDTEDVPYLNEAKGFGALALAWEKEGEVKSWLPFQAEGFADSEPERSGRRLRYEGSVPGDDRPSLYSRSWLPLHHIPL